MLKRGNIENIQNIMLNMLDKNHFQNEDNVKSQMKDIGTIMKDNYKPQYGTPEEPFSNTGQFSGYNSPNMNTKPNNNSTMPNWYKQLATNKKKR